MTCARCGGMTCAEILSAGCSDHSSTLTFTRCINCGDRTDETILQNREIARLEAQFSAAWHAPSSL